jgi:hypothetical protein
MEKSGGKARMCVLAAAKIFKNTNEDFRDSSANHAERRIRFRLALATQSENPFFKKFL